MKQSFNINSDGFYGYLNAGDKKDFVIILYVDDDPNSMIGKGAVKWVASKNMNVLAMSSGSKNAVLPDLQLKSGFWNCVENNKQGRGITLPCFSLETIK